MQTLLEKALTFQRRGVVRASNLSDEDLELAIAFANKQITSSQAAKAWGSPKATPNRLAWILMVAVRGGRLRIKRVDPMKEDGGAS